MPGKKEKTAVVTGATSGIGAAFARKLAARGFDLVVTGRRQEKLRELAEEISGRYGVSVETWVVELSADRDLETMVEKISKREDLEILVNNAGFASKSLFHEDEPGILEALVKVHVLAPVRLARAALPGMIRRGKGAVIHVSSTASFTPRPRQAVYGAAKGFLNLFSESLHLELKKTGVGIQVLCPGLTRTDFHEKMGLQAEDVYRSKGSRAAMSPENVVDASLRCLEKGRLICIPGSFNRAAALAARVIPRCFLRRLLLFRRLR